MSELLHCPFCGWKASERTVGDYFQIGCSNYSCLAYIIDMPVYLSRQEAVNDWNTRAERTCKVVDYNRYMFSYSVYLSCGHEISEINYFPRYCPKCGAKVEVIQDANV